MAFESLSERYEFKIQGFPEEWLPLLNLYDPDLPLFPLLYFHFLDPALPKGHRAGERDRVFGFVHHVNFDAGSLSVTVAVNKDFTQESNGHLRSPLEQEVRERFGLNSAIRLPDISGALGGRVAAANLLLDELWFQVVDKSFGKALPFGNVWDGVFGLVRFIASWNSDGGRKGELIQTHYFASAFGQRIATGGGINADFYLLPTYEEFSSIGNPLSIFPRFADLVGAAQEFVDRFCTPKAVSGHTFSAFRMAATGAGTKLDTKSLLSILDKFHGARREALHENYNAFNRGPHRSVIALMMLCDLRNGAWSPKALTPAVCASMYESLGGSYQTPKVIQLYAQQCFGSACALPIDNWVQTFLEWPFGFQPTTPSRYYSELFSASDVWGKVERLIWLASQARKVHSSVCAEILWCIRFGDPDKGMRGANPLACKICAPHIRKVCPAHASIKTKPVQFNAPSTTSAFNVTTTAGNNTAPNQAIQSCRGFGTSDQYSPRDRPREFAAYPISGHTGTPMTVDGFIQKY